MMTDWPNKKAALKDTQQCDHRVFFQITPPFKPQVMNETDTSNFDFEFTGASVELTPPEHDDGPSEYGTIAEAAGEETDEPFSQFSYDPGASVMTNSSSLQSRSVHLIHFVILVFFTPSP